MSDMEGGIPLPPHVYVPGRTARHPVDRFAALRDSVQPGMTSRALAATPAFRAGLLYLDRGYFWECHEVLEAVWMQTPEASAERDMVQALIQLANARLKLLMDRPRAALRLCGMVRAHLARLPSDRPTLGLEVGEVAARVDSLELGLMGQ